MKRYLDYGKRLKNGQGIEEMGQWVGRILLDDGQVYDIDDRARAFEIGVIEYLARNWAVLNSSPASLILCGPVDKTTIYRHLLQEHYAAERRSALAQLLAKRYGKLWSFIEARAAAIGTSDEAHEAACTLASSQPLLAQFAAELDAIEPLEGAQDAAETNRLTAEAERHQATAVRLGEQLDIARGGARQAQRKLAELEAELMQTSRQLRDEKENSEKLREERSRRIRLERETRDADRELVRLKAEYVKLDERLQKMAQRVIDAERSRGAASLARIDLKAVRQLEASQILGIADGANADEVGQLRRRFAAAFHSDRAASLPGWVKQLFDELMSVVNEACDRVKR